MSNPTLFTADGLAIRRAELVPLTPAEMRFFKDFHAIAQKHNLGLHCGRCGQDIQGDNNDSSTNLKIKCNCREFVGARV